MSETKCDEEVAAVPKLLSPQLLFTYKIDSRGSGDLAKAYWSTHFSKLDLRFTLGLRLFIHSAAEAILSRPEEPWAFKRSSQ